MYFLFALTLFVFTGSFAQKQASVVKEKHPPVRKVTIEPGIGIHTNFGTDFLITNLIQWNPYKHLSFASHSSFNINNIFQREFNGIKTDHNYSINQKFGIGTTLYSKRSSNTILLMIGARYTDFRETIVNPEFNKTSIAVRSVSPDYGVMYSFKKGVKKYFFSFRMYVPIYPWPVKDFNILYIDGNRNNIALECGLGIKIK